MFPLLFGRPARHRVLGADGKLTCYAGGLAAKQALLDLERRHNTLGIIFHNAR